MKILKIAIVQEKAKALDVSANLYLAIKIIKKAKEKGSDIVLFPEMWSHGYAPPFEGAFDNPLNPKYKKERNAWLDSAIKLESDFINQLKYIAKELSIGVVISFLEKTKSKPKNSAVIIDKNGDIILHYSKVHTCDFSLEMLFQNGTDFPVCEFDGVKLGTMICYDREFPESARLLMLNGAEIILVPNACDINKARLNQLTTRAFENMVGVAMANYPDKGWGQSCAYSPIVFDEQGRCIDNLIISADDETQGIIIAEFDINALRKYRNVETWGNAYRKPNAYAKLVSKDIKEPFIR